jgi:hypothetical protein
MDINGWLLLALLLVSLVALVGFFCTKTKGFGRFAVSAPLSTHLRSRLFEGQEPFDIVDGVCRG